MIGRCRPLLGLFILVAAVTVPASSTSTLVAGAPGTAVAGAAAGAQGVTLAPLDFDGDHKTDWAIVRNAGSGPSGQLVWFIGTQTGGVTVTPWGLGGDYVVPGDYDGDGKADIAVWRPGNPAKFYVRMSSNGGLIVQAFGETGDDPTVVADYDGDGRTDFAVYRQGATPGAQSRWFWVRSSDNQVGARAWGLHGDVPAPGDYDGDHIADLGVRRDGGAQSVFYLQQSTAGFKTVSFGFSTDTVVPGDYDADGKTDVAVARVTSGQMQWYVLRSSDSVTQGLTWGVTNDLPVQGDYDGDGRTDAAIWRPSADPTANRFWVLASTGGALVQQWGLQHDYPVANFNARGSSKPSITSAASTTFAVGTPGSFTITSIGFPRPAIVQGGSLPSGVTFTDHGDGSGVLAGTPATGSSGTFPLTFQAINAAGSSELQNFSLSVVEPPTITCSSSVTFIVGQAGSSTVTTTGSPTPTIGLAVGASLPSGVTFTDNHDGTATIAGTPAPGTGGVYPLTITASNTAGSAPACSETLTVNAPPAITSAAATTMAIGQAGTFTITTTGFPAGAGMTIGQTGALPSGVTFTDNGDGTATIAGTPGAGAGGAYPLTIAASNGVSPNATQDFTLTVNQPPAITSAAATTFTVGSAGTFTVTTSGFPTGASMAISATGALPSGVTLVDNGNGTATLAGTPGAATGGSYPLTITANNGVAPSATQDFELTVNQAPVITSATATTFTVGSAGTFTVTTTGFPTGATMVITRTGALPSGVTFVDNGDGTATLAGTPAASTGGTYPITITANNGVTPNGTQNFTLTVHQAPVVTSASGATFVVGAAGSFTVTTSGFPSPTIARGGVTLPSGLTFVDNLNGTGTLSGTPGASTAGGYAITFMATNTVGSSPLQNFTLVVNELPVAGNDGAGTIDANTGLSGAASGSTNLLFNDALGSPAATLVSFGGGSLGGTPASFAAGATVSPLPSFSTGSLVVNANGSYTFVAPTGFTGTFTFSYRLTNAAGDSDGTVTIGVRPVAVADAFAPVVIGNVSIDIGVSVLAANDVANPSFTPGVIGTTSAAGGQVSAANGVITYNPPAGFEGADSFSYTITDGSGFTSAPATVSLTVGGMIWFVDNAAAVNGDGRQSSPFNSLQNFVAVNDGVGNHPNDWESIFLYQHVTSYSVDVAPLRLRDGQRMIGQDHLTQSLAQLAEVTVPAGSTLPAMHDSAIATTIASTVELGHMTRFHGLTINTGAAPGVIDPVAPVAGSMMTDVIVETTTGNAVDLSDMAGTFSFRSVSANGAVHGISLRNTSGSFTVTGHSNGLCGGNVNTGSDPYAVTEPDVADCTGGTIQNTTSNGIRLINASTIDLSRMHIANTVGSGIKGSESIENFFFTNGFIEGSHDAVLDGANTGDESNIAFNDNVTGTEINVTDQFTVNRSTFRNGLYHAIDIVNYGEALNLSIIFNVYTSSAVPSESLGSAVRLMARGNATTAASVGRAIISNSVFTNFPNGAGVEVVGGNPDPTGPDVVFGVPHANVLSTVVVVPNNRFIGSAANPMQHAVVARFEGKGQGSFHIINHGTFTQPVTNIAGDVLVVDVRGEAFVTAAVTGSYIVANHAVDSTEAVGIRVTSGEFAGASAELEATIANNTIAQVDGTGLVASATEGQASMNVRVSGNTVQAPLGLGTATGILVRSGSLASTDNAVCLDIFGNTSAGENGGLGIGLRKEGTAATTHDFGVEGMAVTDSPDVEAFIAGQNAAGGGVTLLSGTSGFAGCGTAPRPAIASLNGFRASAGLRTVSITAPRAVGKPVF